MLEALLEAVQRQGFDPDVLIVDSVRRVLAGSELEPADVATFWWCVEGARRAGKTVILAHHLRKPRGREGGPLRERISGTTDFLGGADVVFMLDRKPRTETLTVECVKARAMPEPLPFSVFFWWSSREARAYLRFSHAGQPKEEVSWRRRQTREHARTVILSALREDLELPTRALLYLAAEEGVKPRTAERALRELKRAGRLTQPRHGWWCLAEPAA